MSNCIEPADLWEVKRVGRASLAPNGRGAFPVTTFDTSTDESFTQIYTLPEQATLTKGTSATSPAIDQAGSRVAFLRKVDGIAQVHVIAIDGGEAEPITHFPLGADGMRWLPDGSGLIVGARVYGPDPDRTKAVVDERAESKVTARSTEATFYRHWDTWLTEDYVPHLFHVTTDGVSTDLTPTLTALMALPSNEVITDNFDVSPDGRQVVFSAALLDYQPLPRPRFELFSVPIAGGPLVALTPENPGDDIQPRFLSDGRIVFGASTELDYYGTPVYLTILNDGAQTRLAEGWDLSPSSWTTVPDDDRILAIAESAVRTNAYLVPLDGTPPQILVADGSVGSPAVSDVHVYLLRQTLSQPPELVRAAWSTGQLEEVTSFNEALLHRLDLGEVEDTSFAGADGVAVQMFVIYPPGFEAGRRYPLVHMIHGGPHGSFGDVWHQRWNAHAFAAPGYVVAMVNFHGSSSFGHDFTSSITGAWGDLPTKDILAATDALIDRGFIDPDRMAITGGSYGGYLTTWLATQTNRFACAIAHAAVTNLAGMYATDWTTGLSRAAGAAPWEDPVRHARWSPSAHYSGYETPTLVIHGERDYRVPVGQGLELYGVLRAMGVDSRLVYFPDENHWILKPNNSIYWYSEVHDWLARYLGSPDA